MVGVCWVVWWMDNKRINSVGGLLGGELAKLEWCVNGVVVGWCVDQSGDDDMDLRVRGGVSCLRGPLEMLAPATVVAEDCVLGARVCVVR